MSKTDAFETWRERPGKETLLGLLRAHQDTVFNVCFQVLGHRQDAEDAAQEVLLKLLDGVPGIGTAEEFRRWVARVAVNAGLDALRKKRTQEEALRRKADVMAHEGGGADAEALYEGLARLGDEDRALVVEHDLQKATLEEMGGRLGLSAAGVLKRVRAAREELRKVLGAMGMAAALPRIDVFLESARPAGAPAGLIGPAVAAKAGVVAGSVAGGAAAGAAVMASAKAGFIPVAAAMVAAVVGLGSGLVATAVNHRRDQRRIEELEGRLAGSVAAAPAGLAEPERGDDGREVEDLRRSLAEAHRQLADLRAASGRGASDAARAEAEARLEELRQAMAKLVAAKDGPGLLKLLGDFAALGEPGYPEAARIAAMLYPGVEDWGLTVADFYNGLKGPALDLCAWAVLHADSAPGTFRSVAAMQLHYTQAAGARDAWVGALRSEKDPEVLRALSGCLALEGCEGAEAEVTEAARRNAEDAEALANLVHALAAARTPAGDRALEELLRATEPGLREEAELGLLERHPPVAGVFVRTADGESAKGLQRGDIVTDYDGHAVGTWLDLLAIMKLTPEGNTVPVLVNRRGQLVRLFMTGGEAGFIGEDVKPD